MPSGERLLECWFDIFFFCGKVFISWLYTKLNDFCPRWYAKGFLHPDVVASYDYIFIWDEDLGIKKITVKEYVLVATCYSLWRISYSTNSPYNLLFPHTLDL